MALFATLNGADQNSREHSSGASRTSAAIGFCRLTKFVPALGGTEDKLLDECQLRPRTLFGMAHEIFGEFERQNVRYAKKLTRESIDVGRRKGLEAVFHRIAIRYGLEV